LVFTVSGPRGSKLRHTQRAARRLIVVVTPLLCVLATAATAASSVGVEPVVEVGAPLALTSGSIDAWEVGPGLLEADGAFWALATAPDNDSFVIAARSANGSLMAPVRIGAGPGGAVTDALAGSAGKAMVVWESVSNDVRKSGGAWVRARQCEMHGCGAVQALAHWQWVRTGSNEGSQEPNPLPAGNSTGQMWARPAVVSVGGRTIVVFGVETLAGPPTMDWAVSENGRFGSVHKFGASAVPTPVLVPESGGRILAAWLSWNVALPYPRVPARRVDWSIWQPNHGFGSVHSFPAGANAVHLVGAPYQGRAALAWQDSPSGQVKLALQTPSAFTAPTVESTAGDEYDALSLASGGSVLALAITSANSLEVMTSAGGRPFTQPSLPASPVYPHVAVDAAGDTLATWQSSAGTGTSTDVELSTAPPGGALGQPATLGPGTYDDGPAPYTNGSQTLVLWQNQDGQLVTSQITTPTA
jgi:hypothetical protein